MDSPLELSKEIKHNHYVEKRHAKFLPIDGNIGKYERTLCTVRVSPITATRIFCSGSHNVMTVSAATAKTEPSAENAAAVIDFFLLKQTLV